jgi:hypothetical protein
MLAGLRDFGVLCVTPSLRREPGATPSSLELRFVGREFHQDSPRWDEWRTVSFSYLCSARLALLWQLRIFCGGLLTWCRLPRKLSQLSVWY